MRRLVAVVAVRPARAVASRPHAAAAARLRPRTAAADEGHRRHASPATITDPNGQKIDVAVGQRIEFDVTADAPGEIHVHSSPEEQEFEYQTGSSTIEVKPIQAPGQVTVESHTLDKVLFTLVAR